MKTTRRELFHLTVLSGAAACSSIVPEQRERIPRGPEKQVTTVCGACDAGCGITVRVASGNAVSVKGTAGHPVNDGGLCPRGVAEIQNLYHPERLQAPAKRGGERGQGRWQAVSWDAALAELAAGLRGGPAVIGVGRVSPAERHLAGWLAARLGATLVPIELPPAAAPGAVTASMLGSPGWTHDLARAGAVLSLGADWLQEHASPVEAQRAFVAQRAPARRAHLVTAGPRLSITAAKSDEWIPIPLDSLEIFGLALVHVLVREGERAARFPSLVAVTEKFAPAFVEPALGLDTGLVARVAGELGAARAPLVVTAAGRPALEAAGTVLNLMLGAVDREGGLVRRQAVPVPQPDPAPARVAFPPASAGAVLLVGANPLYLAAPSSGWADLLAHAKLVASVSSFIDESAQVADLVLPSSTALESRQLVWGETLGGRSFTSAGPAAVKPLYDTLAGPDLLLRLAAALKIELPWPDHAAYLAAMGEALGAADVLEEGGFVEPEVDAAAAPVPLPADPIAPVHELLSAVSPAPPATPLEYPLALEIFTPLPFAGGLGAHLPFLHGIAGLAGREDWRSFVELAAHDAKAAGLAEGDPVWIESPAGRIRAFAKPRQGLRPGAVAIAFGLGRSAMGEYAAGHGASPLALTGGGPVTHVRVRRAT